MKKNIAEFNDIIIDVLREVGNIGAGNAATALAKMINKKVDMNVPKVNVMDLPEVPELLGGAEKEVCGIFFKLDGDIEGSIMFVLNIQSALNLVNLLMPRDDNTFDEFTFSALQEIGNILSGSYISSLSGLTNLNIHISVPSLAIDMAGAILSVPAIQFGLMGDTILIIENQFIEEDIAKSVQGYFFLIPEIDSYEKLLNSLGVTL
ncbi:MAG: chemotaxis protein CheC [Clostridia bacterium]|nr:chemotaxis protein CheC [Clostridia bacterium]